MNPVRIDKCFRMAFIFPYACTLLLTDDALYLFYTGKYGSVKEAGGFLQGSLNNERERIEAAINPSKPKELDALATSKGSVKIPRAEMMSASVGRYNYPGAWINFIFAPSLTVKTANKNYTVYLNGKSMQEAQQVAAALQTKPQPGTL
jgi:hypothetical protein